MPRPIAVTYLKTILRKNKKKIMKHPRSLRRMDLLLLKLTLIINSPPLLTGARTDDLLEHVSVSSRSVGRHLFSIRLYRHHRQN